MSYITATYETQISLRRRSLWESRLRRSYTSQRRQTDSAGWQCCPSVQTNQSSCSVHEYVYIRRHAHSRAPPQITCTDSPYQ